MAALNQRLQESREKMNLSVEQVSDKIKIRAHIIKAFEEGQFDIVPAVYAKSFILTYSKFLKIPESEIAEDIATILRIKKTEPIKINTPQVKEIAGLKKETNSLAKIAEKNKQKIINIIIYSALGLVFVTILYYSFFDDMFNSNNPELLNLQNEPDTTIIKPKEDKGLFGIFNESSDSLTLSAKASDTAWLEINIDGAQKKEELMYPNQEKKWTAVNYFIITCGNSGSVQFFRNGSPLEIFGKKGTVARNIKITKDQVFNPTSINQIQDTTHKKKIKKKPVQQTPVLLQPASPVNKSFTPSFNKKKENN